MGVVLVTEQQRENRQHFSYSGTELECTSLAVNYYRGVFESVAPYLGDRVLEVGAGEGSFTKLLLERGGEVISLEPSDNLYPRLEAAVGHYPNVQLVHSFLSDYVRLARGGKPLTSAVYINVLEHIEKDEEELRLIYDLLPVGGCLVIFVPALPWLYSQIDKDLGHFRRYYKSELEAKVRQLGLRIVKSRYFDFIGVWAWLIWMRWLGRGLGDAKQIVLYDRFVVPVTQALEKIIPPPIGKNVLLIARKDG